MEGIAQLEAHLPHLNKALSSVLALQKPGVVTQACHASTWVVHTGGSKPESHPWLHGEFETRLGHRKPCLI